MAEAGNTTSVTALAAELGPSKRAISGNRYAFVKFDEGVPGAIQEVDGTAAVVTDQAVNTFVYGGVQFMYNLEQAFAGTAPQVIDAAGGGLKLVIDAADNDGLFFGLPWCTSAGVGTLKTAGRGIFTSQTDAFFVRVKLKVTTVASADEIAVGIRKVVAFDVSAITSTATNPDFACLNVDNGTIKIVNAVNQGAASTTSTTQTVADAGTVTLEVRVSSAGVAKFLVNGAAPTVDVSGFVFDSADTLMPYVSVVADAAGDPGVILLQWESGLLANRGLESTNDLGDASTA